MSNIIKVAKEESLRLEKMLKKIDAFLNNAPEGCLKWQNKKGKPYYYHQFAKEDEKNTPIKWTRKYIKKENYSLAKTLAQKQYYIAIRPTIEKNLNELDRFLRKYQQKELEEIYDDLCFERKNLVVPVQTSVKEKIRQWEKEVYKKLTY